MSALGQSLDVHIQSEYRPEDIMFRPQLSALEVGRLQRAFCRFEIYRHLFPMCPHPVHDDWECDEGPPNSAEQASLYLKNYPDYEISEIFCIRDYLTRRLIGIWNRLEDDSVDALPPRALYFPYEAEDGGGIDVESLEWHHELFFFTDQAKFNIPAQLEYLISCGLPYNR